MKSIEEIRDMLERLGKLKLGFYPTPFHRLDRISGEYGVELYVKREDFSGMTLFGGNKIRKLEYLLRSKSDAGPGLALLFPEQSHDHTEEDGEYRPSHHLKGSPQKPGGNGDTQADQDTRSISSDPFHMALFSFFRDSNAAGPVKR